jgi:hypothetical protein
MSLEFNFQVNSLTDASLFALSELTTTVQMLTMFKLNLSFCLITDKGVRALMGALN